MSSLFQDIECVLNETYPARRFTDVSDKMREKLCDSHTLFHEWDVLSSEFLKENAISTQIYPINGRKYTQSRHEERDTLWNCDEVCGELVLRSQSL